MTAPDVTLAAPLLWLTDRSRYKLGTSRCAGARYLAYHAGPTGYGLAHSSDSLPLATGIYVHEGVEAFGLILRDHDRLPTEVETRAIVAKTCAAYESRVTEKGFRGILGGPHTEETIKEQRTLISGLLWALRIKLLPWLHQQYRLLSVEQERIHFLSCTCGAGPLAVAQHIARGCQGVALMLRTDLLARRREGSTGAYFEIKTTGWESEAWAEQWEIDPQLGLGTLDTQEILGCEVTELYIVGLNKGSRRKDKADGPDGRRKQSSPLCYGYCRPANPPLLQDDWLPSYEWVDAAGEVKRASRAHRRRGVWELADSDWPTLRAYLQQDPSLTPEEAWVRLLPESVLDKVCFVLGPMNRQDSQIASLRRSMLGEEESWQRVLWELYELQTQGYSWASQTFQDAWDRLVPKSWACRPFGKDHQCEFVGLCYKETGWEDPIASGRYRARLPHHAVELATAIGRGLLPAEAVEASEEEER